MSMSPVVKRKIFLELLGLKWQHATALGYVRVAAHERWSMPLLLFGRLTEADIICILDGTGKYFRR
jgi:hypothetical protein